MTVIKFDLAKIAASKPESVGIFYQGKCYRYYSCAECSTQFWKSTDDQYQRHTRIYSVYCGVVCFTKAQKKLNAARQKRYRISYDKKHGKGAYHRRYRGRSSV